MSALFETTIPIFDEGATVTVRADEILITVDFDTRPCVALTHVFGKDSANAVRALGHALIMAADAVDNPTRQ